MRGPMVAAKVEVVKANAVSFPGSDQLINKFASCHSSNHKLFMHKG